MMKMSLATRLTLAFFCLLPFASLFAQSTSSEEVVQNYIERFKYVAIREMKVYGIPASITLAQGILESNAGRSELAVMANNHFGIKCHKEWTGKTFHQDDDEKNECFRKYKSAMESYRDHSDFLITRDRYNFLFDLEINDYMGWAYGLKEAGYATNPRYPEMLIRIIEENGLAKLDEGGSQQLAVGGQRSEVGNQQSELRTQNSELKTHEIFGRGGNDRVIFLNNGIKFILAREGDDFYRIADEFGIYAWQVREYNELKKADVLVPGQKVYLERKKAKAASKWHKVTEGETVQSISQDYGIRKKVLCRLNFISPDDRLKEGDLVRMR